MNKQYIYVAATALIAMSAFVAPKCNAESYAGRQADSMAQSDNTFQSGSERDSQSLTQNAQETGRQNATQAQVETPGPTDLQPVQRNPGSPESLTRVERTQEPPSQAVYSGNNKGTNSAVTNSRSAANAVTNSKGTNADPKALPRKTATTVERNYGPSRIARRNTNRSTMVKTISRVSNQRYAYTTAAKNWR